MKNNIFCLFIAANIILAILPCNFCFAAEPTVEREYIARRMGGESSREERICVNYRNLSVEESVYLRLLFFDCEDSVLGEYKLELSVNAPVQNEMSFISDTLRETAYIYIEIIGSDFCYDGITLPLKI